MGCRYALRIILTSALLLAVSSYAATRESRNEKIFDLKDDVGYYNSMRASQPTKYSVIPASLNFSLHNSGYMSLASEIEKSIHGRPDRWVLLRKVNVEAGVYAIHFFYETKGTYYYSGGAVSGPSRTEIKNKRISKSVFDALQKMDKNTIDFSVNVKDCSVYYFGVFDGASLFRSAFYCAEKLNVPLDSLGEVKINEYLRIVGAISDQ